MCRDLDALAIFETAANSILTSQAPTRYAVRQVLDQELQKTIALRESATRQARFRAGRPLGAGAEVDVHDDKENKPGPIRKVKLVDVVEVKRDFFGRVIKEPLGEADGNLSESTMQRIAAEAAEAKAWVTFHEGLNNAVRKPVSLQEFLRGF